MLDGIDVEVIAVTAQGHLDARLYDEVAAEPVHVGGHIRCRPHDPYVEPSHVIHTHIIHERRPEAGSRHSQPYFGVARQASLPLIQLFEPLFVKTNFTVTAKCCCHEVILLVYYY